MTSRLEACIVHHLRRGRVERFELAPEDLRSIAMTLSSVLRGPSGVHEVERALVLAVALEKELSSPRASETILELLRRDPEARWIVESRILKSGAIDDVRRFQRAEGREEVVRAPKWDRGETAGLRLASFLDPAGGRGGRGVPRVVRRDVQERQALARTR